MIKSNNVNLKVIKTYRRIEDLSCIEHIFNVSNNVHVEDTGGDIH